MTEGARWRRRRWSWALLAVGLASAGGCQLPNVAPFVDATSGLKSAVAAGGSAASARLSEIDPEAGAQLAKAWKTRDAALVAMMRYASTLQDLVEAGNGGADAAGKVADELKSFASAAGIALPGTPEAAALVTDTGKFIAGQIAKAAAARSLEKALEEAQPALDSITAKLKADLGDVDLIIRAAGTQQEGELLGEDANATEFRDGIREELAKVGSLNIDSGLARAKSLAELLPGAEARVSARDGRVAALRQKVATERELIAATGRALGTWSEAHASLIAAAKAKRMVSVTALVEATTEIRDLVKRVREL